MALPLLADVSELANWLGTSIDDADPRAKAVLSAASSLVRSYCGQDFVAEVPDPVASVAIQVAARSYTGPIDGARYTQENAGPFGHLSQYNTDGGGLYLTKSDKMILAAFRTAGVGQGISILPTTRGEPFRQDQYLPVDGGAPIPFLPSE